MYFNPLKKKKKRRKKVKCTSRIPKLYAKHDFFFFSKYTDYLVKYILTIDTKFKIPPNKFCCLDSQAELSRDVRNYWGRGQVPSKFIMSFLEDI